VVPRYGHDITKGGWDTDIRAYTSNPLAQDKDIVAGAPPYSVLLNTGAVAFRNTSWTHHLLQRWYQNRCGFKDQIGLWTTLMDEWAAEDTAFKTVYDARIEELPYFPYMKAALKTAAGVYEKAKLQKFLETDHLDTPAQLPHFLLLSNKPEATQFALRWDTTVGLSSQFQSFLFHNGENWLGKRFQSADGTLHANFAWFLNTSKNVCASPKMCDCF